MEKTQNLLWRTLGIASLTLTVAALAACSPAGRDGTDSAATASGVPFPVATTASPGDATSTPEVTADPSTNPPSRAQSATAPGKPFDPAEAKAWTDDIALQMQGGSGGPALQGTGGHLDDTTSQNRVDRFLSLPAGSYSFSFACRGGGEVTFGITSGEVESPTLSGPCTGQVQAGNFTAVDGGTEFRVRATGDPIDYVVRYAIAD